MYIHQEIQKAVLPLMEKYDLELIELVGEMSHAIHEMAVLSPNFAQTGRITK
ncbi:MAG: hypothetical protein Q8O37_04590 [Sulfuricellaceae bacterium]|nr:hypothetical protein [Sulfuricellaceae bacterium]